MKNGEKEGKELSVGVTVLYTKFDTYAVEEKRRDEKQMERVVGTSRYKKMLAGKRDMFIFC